MSRYVLTAEAQRDITEIRDYLIGQRGLRVARYVLAALVVAFRSLAKQPGMGHRRGDLSSNADLLFWPVFSYLIVYHRGSRPLAVVAVLHGKRDVGSLLRGRTP
jgi:plasmid stabilization system protein ParE